MFEHTATQYAVCILKLYIDVGICNLPVSYNTTTFVFPQCDGCLDIADHFRVGVDHSLPDSTQVAKIEDVMKLGRRRQHLNL